MTKAFERFLGIFLQLSRSRFRLIISEQKIRWKSQGTGVEKKLFRTQSGLQRKYSGVKAPPSSSIIHQILLETEQMLKNEHIPGIIRCPN